MKITNITDKISPESDRLRSLSASNRQGDPRRKNPWFKSHKLPLKNEALKQCMKKRQNANKEKKKTDYYGSKQDGSYLQMPTSSLFEKQPATPHNTTQFITNIAHFSTEPCIFSSNNDSFSQHLLCHSMLGSMREFVLGNRLNSPCGATNQGLASKETKRDFFENAYDLTKIRSESDFLAGEKIEQNIFNPNNRLAHQASQFDIKQLLDGIKDGRSKLESVIQTLVNEIQEKEDLISTLRRQ